MTKSEYSILNKLSRQRNLSRVSLAVVIVLMGNNGVWPWKQEALALEIGASRPIVNKALKILQEKGWIRMEKETVSQPDNQPKIIKLLAEGYDGN